ncbi:MAG: cyanophycinase [Acidobacteriota bacterium]
MAFLVTVCLVTVCLALAAPTSGDLLLIGGGEKPPAVMRAFIDLAGGPQASIIVFPTASELADTSEYYKALFAENGASNVRGLELRTREQARDPDVLADGAVIGGTSAGTACMSELMITGDGDFTVLRANNVAVSEGLGLFPDAILDQHFVARQRQNRLLSLVLEHPDRLGIGVDEATAVWWRGDGTFDVLGEGWVEVYDASGATVRRLDSASGPRLGADGVRHHVLMPGDRFDLGERRRVEEAAGGGR